MSLMSLEILEDYIRENQEKLYKVAYTYTRNQDLALDVVQEAITKSLENISKLKHEEYVKTWFYRILINESLKVYKRNKKYIQLELQEDIKTNQGYNEDKIAENIDIYNNIQKLDNKLKTVIILRFFENLKIEEIAVITKTNVNTVKSRLYKGLNEMKKNIERR